MVHIFLSIRGDANRTGIVTVASGKPGCALQHKETPMKHAFHTALSRRAF